MKHCWRGTLVKLLVYFYCYLTLPYLQYISDSSDSSVLFHWDMNCAFENDWGWNLCFKHMAVFLEFPCNHLKSLFLNWLLVLDDIEFHTTELSSWSNSTYWQEIKSKFCLITSAFIAVCVCVTPKQMLISTWNSQIFEQMVDLNHERNQWLEMCLHSEHK